MHWGALSLAALVTLPRGDAKANGSCASACLGRHSCDAVVEALGVRCTDLEDVVVWQDHTCDCVGCKCEDFLGNAGDPWSARNQSSVDSCLTATHEDEIAGALDGVACIHIDDQIDVLEELVVQSRATIHGGQITAVGTGHRLFFVMDRLELVHTTVENGIADVGGCVFVMSSASLLAQNTLFRNCSAALLGGSIAAWSWTSVELISAFIQNSYASIKGGGIYVHEEASVVLNSTKIHFAYAGESGGGFFAYRRSNCMIVMSEIRNCVATTRGGGLTIFGHTEITDYTSISHCTSNVGGGAIVLRGGASIVVGRTASITNSSSQFGGAMTIFEGSHGVVSNHFESCVAWHMGGGFVVWTGSTVEFDGTVLRCDATTFGGGVVLWANSAGLMAGRIEACRANHGGGVYQALGSELSIRRGIISQSIAFYNGGALSLEPAASVNIMHTSKLAANYAGEAGGGIYVGASSRASISNGSTIVDCASGVEGGAAAVRGSLHLRGPRVSMMGNSAGTGGACAVRGMGIVTLSGDVDISGNVADSRGGGIDLEGTARFYASSSKCEWVELQLITSSQSTLEEARAVLLNQERLPYDARGRTTEIASVDAGAIVTKYACMPRDSPFTVSAYSGDGNSWEDGMLVFHTLMRDVDVKETLTIARHTHAEVASVAPHPVAPGAPRLASNLAMYGGAIAANDGAALYAFEINIDSNEAIFAGAGCDLEMFAYGDIYKSVFRNNEAGEVGGGVHVGMLSSLTLEAALAELNSAMLYGGFADLNTADEVELYGVEIKSNVAARGGGIAAESVATSATLSEITFEQNTADEGGGLYVHNSDISVVSPLFKGNQARNGGALASVQDRGRADVRVTDSVCAFHLIMLIDFTKSGTCIAVPWGVANSGDRTCDSSSLSCFDAATQIRAFYGNSSSFCDGCACFQFEERYASIFDSAGKELLRMTPRASAVIARSVCLDSADDLFVQAFDAFGDAFNGGLIKAILVKDGFETEVRDIPIKWRIQGTETEPYRFVIDNEWARRSLATASSNVASGGGGGVYWSGRSVLGSLRNVNNSALYGEDTATPAVEVRFLNDTGQQVVASGQVIGRPIRLVLLDAYGQIVESSNGVVASVRALENEGVTFTNAISEFYNGVCVIEELQVTALPGKTVNAIIIIEVSSLSPNSLHYNFFIRTCFINEFQIGEVCRECPEGYFLDLDGRTCTDCKRGIDCDKSGSSIHDLKVERGWYRTVRLSTEAYVCDPRKSCKGGEYYGFPKSCRAGYTGIRCGACQRHYFRSGRHCVKCREGTRKIALIVLGIIFGAVIFPLCFWLLFVESVTKVMNANAETRANGADEFVLAAASTSENPDNSGDGSEKLQSRWTRAIIKLKFMLSFGACTPFIRVMTIILTAQIMGSIPAALYGIRLPKAFYFILIFYHLFSSLAVTNIVSSNCLFEGGPNLSFVRTLTVLSTTPILIGLILVSLYKARCALSIATPPSVRLLYFEIFFITLHIILPAISVYSFLALECWDYDYADRGRKAFLRVAPAISCSSGSWRNFIAPFACCSIVLYPIGVPAMYAVLLYRYRTVLLGTFVHTHNEMDSLRQDKALWKMIQKSPKIQREFDFERRTYLESHSHDALTIRCEFDVLFRLRAHYLRGPRSPLGRCATDRRSTSNCFFSLKKILCLLNIASFDSHMLCAQYQPRSFYFEVIETTRRISLTAVITILFPGSPYQLCFAYIISLMFFILTLRLQPFFYDDDNLISLVAQFSTSAMYFCGLLLRTGTLSTKLSSSMFIILALIPLFSCAYAMRYATAKPIKKLAAVSTELLSRKSFRLSARFDRDTILTDLGIDPDEDLGIDPDDHISVIASEESKVESDVAPSDAYEDASVTRQTQFQGKATKLIKKTVDFQANVLAHDRLIMGDETSSESST